MRKERQRRRHILFIQENIGGEIGEVEVGLHVIEHRGVEVAGPQVGHRSPRIILGGRSPYTHPRIEEPLERIEIEILRVHLPFLSPFEMVLLGGERKEKKERKRKTGRKKEERTEKKKDGGKKERKGRRKKQRKEREGKTKIKQGKEISTD